jgi:hypothetical protein
MRDFFRNNRADSILFAICAVAYIAVWALWTIAPLNGGHSLADTDNVAAGIPIISVLPTQSVSKLVITSALYALAIVYALLSLAGSSFRRVLPQFVGFGVLTFLAWGMLNFWVISGFLNSPDAVIYGIITVVLLAVWLGGLMRFVSVEHDATALFLVRLGLGMSMFITIVQLISTVTPGWRSPTQGIPVLYTMTLNALVGLFLAGVGGNMLWRERRAQVLAAGRRR